MTEYVPLPGVAMEDIQAGMYVECHVSPSGQLEIRKRKTANDFEQIFDGYHQFSEHSDCAIVGLHFHGEEEGIFYRPKNSEHYKVNGVCRVVTGENGRSVRCVQHNNRSD
jgi:hypothetical protein